MARRETLDRRVAGGGSGARRRRGAAAGPPSRGGGGGGAGGGAGSGGAGATGGAGGGSGMSGTGGGGGTLAGGGKRRNRRLFGGHGRHGDRLLVDAACLRGDVRLQYVDLLFAGRAAMRARRRPAEHQRVTAPAATSAAAGRPRRTNARRPGSACRVLRMLCEHRLSDQRRRPDGDLRHRKPLHLQLQLLGSYQVLHLRQHHGLHLDDRGAARTATAQGTCMSWATRPATAASPPRVWTTPTGVAPAPAIPPGRARASRGRPATRWRRAVLSGTTCSPDGDPVATPPAPVRVWPVTWRACRAFAPTWPRGGAARSNRAACSTDGSSCGGSLRRRVGACSATPTGACGRRGLLGQWPLHVHAPAATCNGSAGTCVAQAAQVVRCLRLQRFHQLLSDLHCTLAVCGGRRLQRQRVPAVLAEQRASRPAGIAAVVAPHPFAWPVRASSAR